MLKIVKSIGKWICPHGRQRSLYTVTAAFYAHFTKLTFDLLICFSPTWDATKKSFDLLKKAGDTPIHRKQLDCVHS